MKSFRWLALTAAFATVPAMAVREYYSTSRSVRALGMGGAFYGLSDDIHALHYNPAGLSRIKTGRFTLLGIRADFAPKTFDALSTITKSAGKDVQQIADSLAKYQGNSLYGGVGVDFLGYAGGGFGIGLQLADVKMNTALLGRDLDTAVEVTAISDSGLFIGYSQPLLDDTLHIGVAAKGIVRGGGRKQFTLLDIAQRGTFQIDPQQLGGAGGGIDFDLGATYQLPLPIVGPLLQTNASLVFNNLLASKFNLFTIKGSNPPGLVRTMSIAGHSVLSGWGPFANFHVLLDFAEFSLGGESNPDLGARGGSFFKHVNLGIEAPMSGGWFVPRLGIHQGYFTAGFTVDVRVLKIDFATYAEELASGVDRFASRRFAVRLALGWGGEPPPAITGGREAVKKDVEEKKQLTPMEMEEAEKLKQQPVPAPTPVTPQAVPVEPPPATPTPAPTGIPQLEDPAKAPATPTPAPAPAAEPQVEIPSP